MRERKRWLWLLVAVALVGASIGVLPALGQPVTSDFGVLNLHLDSAGDRLVFDPAGAGSNIQQDLTSSGCKLGTQTGDPILAAFAATSTADPNAYPGIKDHSIGVGQRGEGNGEPCGQVDDDLGQTLTFTLSGPTIGDKAINYAEIDLEFKFEGEATLILKRDGATVGSVAVPCNEASDCGPDSGGNDNVRVVISGFVFDTMVIVPPDGGSVSLEGGGDNPATGDHTFFNIVEVFEGQIDCGETESEDGVAADSDITRGNDTNGGCKGPDDGLLFNFNSGVNEDGQLFVDFVTAPVDGTAVAQYLEVITWDFAAPPDVPGGDDQHLTLFYDDHVGDGVRVMPWCEIDPRDSGGVGGLPTAGLDPDTVLPEGHTSCLIESTSEVDSTGAYSITDTVYNVGDGIRLR